MQEKQDKKKHKPNDSAIPILTTSGSVDSISASDHVFDQGESTDISPESLAFILNLRSVKPDISNQSDKLTQSEIKKQAIERGNLENKSLDQDIREREKYTDKIYNLIYKWLQGIGLIILFQGFLPKKFFYLSDKVLIALIGGTTINVLGLFAIVVCYLFRKPKD